MIHPSYVDLMKVVNKNVEEGETPVINSRYSIVMATARRARQLVDGDESLVEERKGEKPLSIAVEELNQGKIRILTEEEIKEYEAMKEAEAAAEEADATVDTADEEAPAAEEEGTEFHGEEDLYEETAPAREDESLE